MEVIDTMNQKRMDELGFIIWTSGRLDKYGKRNKQEQKELDQSISHMQSFERDISHTLLFKMLNINLNNFSDIATLSKEIATKNMIAFVNCNTFDINGEMIGFLFLPQMNSPEQATTLQNILPIFSDFKTVAIWKKTGNTFIQLYEFSQQQLQNTKLVETIITNALNTVETQKKRVL